MYRICKSIELESGHLLSKHPGNCQFPHGHTRSVELVFAAETLDSHEMVMDFKAIKEMLGEFLEQFAHALCMNANDPNYEKFRAIYGARIIPLEQGDPTSEAKARVEFAHAAAAQQHAQAGICTFPVRDCVRRERVRVWETSSSWAEYEE